MPAKLERCVTQVTPGLLAKWRKRNPGKEMSEKVRKKLRSSAYAICTKSTNEEVTTSGNAEDSG